VRFLVLVLIVGSLLLTQPFRVGGQESRAPVPCQAESAGLTILAAVRQRVPYVFEIELTIRNGSAAIVRLDPAGLVLVPDRGAPVKPLTLDQTIQPIRAPISVGVSWLAVFGSFGIFVNVDSQELLIRDVEARFLSPAPVAPGATLKGSAYFRPQLELTQFDLLVDELTMPSGEPLAALLLRTCPVPGRTAGSRPAGAPPEGRAAAPNARGAAGPFAATVRGVLLTADATTISVSLENGGAVEGRLFNALADARLTDQLGRVYPVRMLRSDVPDRVAPGGSVHGRLVFAPLPLAPTTRGATLTLPGVAAGDAAYDLNVEFNL
jgi:hypothetical protein